MFSFDLYYDARKHKIKILGQGFVIFEASRSHSGTPHSAGLLWTSDQSDAEASTWQHTVTRDKQPCPRAGFEPAFPTSEWPQTHSLDYAAVGIWPKPSLSSIKTFANVDECFAMYITCEILVLKQSSILAHGQWRKMKLSGLHFRLFVLVFAACYMWPMCCCMKLDYPELRTARLDGG